MNQVRVFSPAKVNLHLDISERRPDGYHGAYSIMHALSMHDMLTMRREFAAPGSGLVVDVHCATHGDIAELDIPAESNIAYKAVVRLAEALGRTGDDSVLIGIDKNIPHAAGLGGGSSNAAAALLGACALWDIDLADAGVRAMVEQVASGLGADVPFFLHGGCVALTDKGDIYERDLVPSKRNVVIVRPDEGVSTGAAYAAFDANPPLSSDEVKADARAAESADELHLFNNLAPASEGLLPVLTDIREWLSGHAGVAHDATTGAPQVLLCGSGSSTFAICDDFDAAYKLVGDARLNGWWARSCNFTSAGARVLPTEGQATNLGAVQKSW
ncbi:4-(cytidine 5'-diphospho)-2-C-methyl-D-erythritol kinase [Slackia heliotrinireducens]|uniref:4-(cytidine 5'-diphospho)-2-C-methyl-D-erythritol kinase n=1 Tax=Slackia heliotrinireducens TaxID=84110 RepID=UPI0033156611